MAQEALVGVRAHPGNAFISNGEDVSDPGERQSADTSRGGARRRDIDLSTGCETAMVVRAFLELDLRTISKLDIMRVR